MTTSPNLYQQQAPVENGGERGALDVVLSACSLVLVMPVVCGATFVWRIVRDNMLVAQSPVQLQALFEPRLGARLIVVRTVYPQLAYPSITPLGSDQNAPNGIYYTKRIGSTVVGF